MTWLEVLVFLLYIGWLLISLLAQGRSSDVRILNKKLRKWDVFNVIPNYKFFCPKPAQLDYHLFFHFKRQDGSWDNWTELDIRKRHPFWCFIWNPHKRGRKVLVKFVKSVREKHKREKGHLYYMMLNSLRNYVTDPEGTVAQFKVISRQDLLPSSEDVVVYISEVHKIKA
jgi:hypothetical protein